MYRFYPIVQFVSILILWLCINTSRAAVIVTPASGTCVNNTPGAFTSIGNIDITEGANSDFSIQAGVTFILSAPSGFEFLAGTGTVTAIAGRNITTTPAPTIAVTATTITITYSVTATNKTDAITISGIQVRGLVAGSSGFILRTGGTATIVGDAIGGGINHGTLTSNGAGAIVSSVINGNWSSGSTWSTGQVPTCGQDIVINHTVTVDVASSTTNLTINTGGNLIASNTMTVSGTFTITGTGIYTHSNTGNASTTIFAGSESFTPTSNIILNQWYDVNVPIGSLVSSTFGNITFNTTGTWQQDGYFAPARVLGNIIVNSGTVVMDDGTGMTTSLTLKDVTINGSGNMIICSGPSRNFSFTTNNFADNGTGATLTTVKSSCSGSLNWTVFGDVVLHDNFNLITNSGTASTVAMNVSGNMYITGGNIDFLESTDAPLSLTVTGRTSITGTPGYVSLVNSGSGELIFNTGFLELNVPATIELITGSFSGPNQFNISNDILISGATTILYLVNNSGYAQDLNLTTGRDISVTDGDFYVANSNGRVNINCGRHLTVSGVTSEFNGQYKVSNPSLTEITVSGTLTLTAGVFYHTKGEGDITLTVGETLLVDNGYFYGLSHAAQPAAATANITLQDFIFQGGEVKFFNLKTAAPTTVTINCTNNFDITWESNTDIVELVSYDGNNDASLVLNIGGSFNVSGNFANAYFLSSKAGGDEVVTINGNFSVSGGKIFFVCDNTSTNGVDAHNITTSIGGNIQISGGLTYLSTRDGNTTVTVQGDFIISSGVINLKWLTGASTMTINGNYNQTGGFFNMHSRASTMSDTCNVVVNGNFSQTAGTYNFDSGSGPAEHTLTINGPSFTVGGTGSITHINNLSTTYVFGHIYFNRTGTIIYSRFSSTHNIQHVRQTILAGTTVNASSSTNGFQMTSVASNNTTTHNALTINGTLDMGNKVLKARQYANYYSRVTVNSGGRYRTSHTGGLYSGSSTVTSSIDGYISTLNRVSYYLHANSIVEYYGTATSVVTGVPNGIATTTDQQYGILDINFTGAAGSTWVNPETDNEVHIRTSLTLTAGEFNLDNDHSTTSGGRSINLEAGATTARTSGFIRSETQDGSGVVKWNILTNGSNTIPFGYDAATYIPFTFQQTSGSAGIVQIGTFRTIANNTPLPPSVTHVRDVYGVDNSAQTVDRFWNIVVPGTAGSTLVFTYAPSEGTGIISPRAQQWEPVTKGWFLPAGVQSNPTAITTSAAGLSSFNTWWTLSALGSPLPIKLIQFDVKKVDGRAEISWLTQTEINNDFFTVERSRDGWIFEPIKIVSGAGTSTSPLAYEFVDEKPLEGTSYYRLKQTDYDGQFSYSETKSVYFGKDQKFSVYPSILTQDSPLNIEIPDKGIYEISIVDLIGKVVYHTSEESTSGERITLSPLEMHLGGGVYFILIQNPESTYSQKLIFRN